MKRIFITIFLLSNVLIFGQSLTLTSPNGGERLQQGVQSNITWTTTGVATNVLIECSTDNGATWPITVVASTPAATGSYSYNYSITPSNQCLIRISDAANAADFDVSDNLFTVVSLTLNSPNGGEFLQAGKQTNILWTSNQISNVKLEYTTNNGTSWTTIVSSVNAALGTYQWNIPDLPSTGCRIRVSDVTNSIINDASDATFTIKRLVLSTPNGGENFLQGSTQTIAWSSANVANVNLEYSVNGGTNYSSIAASVSAASGSYNWTVPVGTSTNCLIRISDAANISVNDESDFAFTVSTLSLTTPAGGANWKAGTSNNITWSSTNITNLKIDYTTNNGATWLSVVASVPAASGSYAWNVPNTPSTQCKVRLSDLSYQSNLVTSGLFTIEPIPTIVVTSPNGFENWKENTSQNITWTATYNIANVNIEFTSNNGSNWSNVATNIAANLGTYAWTVPSSFSQNCRIRISSSADASVNDASDNTFTISSLNLTSPDGGEKFQVGKIYNITWNYQNISNIKIEYTTNDGSTWNTIIGSVSTTALSYAWTVPNSTSVDCRIRISDISNASINDVSTNKFTIASVNVVSPNGGENLLEASTQAITWTSTNITNVKLEYSSNSGSTWTQIVASTPASAGTYNWSVPATSASTYYIRVSDAADANINDRSDNLFTVSKINLTAPIGGENWKVGTSHDITWNSSATITNVKLEYSTNNGSSWNVIVPSIAANLLTYRWIVPNAPSINCKVRISNVSSPDVFSTSPSFFTISKSLIVTSPNGGENWEVGSIRNITWSRDPVISFIRIQYTPDNGLNWTDINNYVDASLGTYAWTIPNVVSSNCKVRITDVNNVTNIDSSDAKFSILSTPSITVTRPNGGETFETGAVENITWSSSNINFVKIEYSLNNGSTWNLIKSNQASTGSYAWNVPNINSNQCKVRISDQNNSNVFDISDNKFTIVPRIVLSAPNGGEDLPVASNFTVIWTSTNVTNIKIDYSTDSGSSWTNVTTSTPAAAGTYTWMVPNASSTNCLLKLSDATKPEVFDVSDNVFTISNKLRLVSPNGGESWQSTSQKTIQWQSTGINNVALQYSTNNGVNWTNIVSSVSAASGSYTWTLPSTTSDQYKVKVNDVANASVFDISDNVFKVTAIDLKTPNGSENYAIGSTQNITWTSTLISKVKLEYSINNGLDWITIVDSIASSGIYYWPVPNTPSTQCKVRISETGNSATTDISANVFTISESPTVKVLYPNGKENFGIGKTEVIKWTSNNVNNVKIEYSVNGGTSWFVITSATSSTGTYNWVVPNAPSNNCKIKVTDSSRPGVFDVSDSAFTITSAPKLTVTSPNGNEVFKAGTAQSILWTSSSVDSVRIEYSINNGVSWKTISSSTPSTGLFIWQVPYESSYQCRIKVTDTNNSSVNDQSDNPFTIAVIDLLKPADGEILLAGSPYTILWNCAGIINLKIELSTNDGVAWTSIASTFNALAGSYGWTIPSTNVQQARIRISDASKATIFDMNESSFSIKQIIVISPGDNSNFKVGTTQTIRWKSYNIANVKLEYSTDSGLSWKDIIAAVPGNIGFYDWVVPNSPSEYCTIRISDASNKNNFATNVNFFKIEDTQTSVGSEKFKPAVYSLAQNYPNPFNPTTIISYQIPFDSHVTLKIYDLLGREVAVLVNEYKPAGFYQSQFSILKEKISSGVYIYRIQAGSYSASRKMIVLQ